MKVQLHPETEDIFENHLVSSSKGLLLASKNRNSMISLAEQELNDQVHSSTKAVSVMYTSWPLSHFLFLNSNLKHQYLKNGLGDHWAPPFVPPNIAVLMKFPLWPSVLLSSLNGTLRQVTKPSRAVRPGDCTLKFISQITLQTERIWTKSIWVLNYL